jgi:integrase/recombinase XerD
MGKLQAQMIMTMRTHGYSDKTIKLYTASVRALARYYRKTPLDVTKQQIADFIHSLRVGSKSESTIRVYFEAIKFFYRLHGLAERIPSISFRRIAQKIPVILSQDEVSSLLENCASLKFKTLFALIYSAGLRVSEAANLRVEDIDFARKTIHVKNGKNGKDRLTILADETASLLQRYYRVFYPQKFVFYSKDIMGNISVDCIQRRFKRLCAEQCPHKSVHIHTLRHCFATHLLENGTSIFYIMKLLGHSNIQTTMVYLHMESLENLKIRSPIDSQRFQAGKRAVIREQSLFQESA